MTANNQIKAASKVRVGRARVEALAERTADAYSFDRYTSWEACARELLERGYSDQHAEVILRSKITRWAADGSTAKDGRATSVDLGWYLAQYPELASAVIAEAS